MAGRGYSIARIRIRDATQRRERHEWLEQKAAENITGAIAASIVPEDG